MFCPDWIFDVSSARVASEFLGADLPLEALATKYANGLSEKYTAISPEELSDSAQLILGFLAEVEAGESAVRIINEFCYFRLYYSKVGIPRKLKPLFGSIEDPVKQKEYSGALMIKAFRTHTFNVRGNPEIAAPAGWNLEDDQHIADFGDLVRKQSSLLDSF
ncbi:MAG: hypothetical protein CBB97_25115 [Candidatus Endolissoclinum sp. TMED37]|nr:MAG: hypothetical protein CBB97_25115 [Candidatus Endolissoclinum sp. TMED37]